MSPSPKIDLLISGAGAIGGALACALSHTGLRITMVDPQDPSKRGPDERAYAISYGAMQHLMKWGIWDHIKEQAFPIHTIRTTQKNGGAGLTYRASEMKVEALGFMVPAHLFQQAVWDQVKTSSTVTWIPGKISRSQVQESNVKVILENSECFETALLVGAEGHASALRDKIGGSTLKYTYEQTALVCKIRHTESHQNTAFEHFTPIGPLAFLPLPENHSAIVWSLDPERAQECMKDPKIFLHALIHHFGWGLGDLELVSPLQQFPLRLLMPQRTWSKRGAIIGDAAHVIHPLAGQGLNVGLRDVAALAADIERAYLLGLDIGSLTLLKAWGEKRRPDQWSMAGLTHGLVRLFQLDNPILNKGMALGFWSVEHFPPLKKWLTRHAMGI